MNEREALIRVLNATGVALPRGVLGEETVRLAQALGDADPAAVTRLVDAAANVHWPVLRGPMAAAIARGERAASDDLLDAFGVVSEWAGNPDPDNPLARALVVRAAGELASAWERSREVLHSAQIDPAGNEIDLAARASTAAGAIAVILCDLDPDDFAPEIAAYLNGDAGGDAVEALARSTGDLELREWVREALSAFESPDDAQLVEAIRALAGGPPPEDPAHDFVWVPAVLALAQEALERVGAQEIDDAQNSAHERVD